VIFLSSCSLSKQNKSYRSAINGSWTLSSITHPNNPGEYTAVLFNVANAPCYNGSTWNFISNNSTGNYTFANPGCGTDPNYVRWSIYEPGDGSYYFQFKPIDEKKNSTNDNTGYRLNILSLNDTKMVLSTNVQADGKPFTLNFNFTK
jgi:hypothetical protein